jgi:CRP-like cAMP-binding protein
MPLHEAARFLGENRILALLPDEERKRLMLHLQPIRLVKGKVLYEVGRPISHAYFLLSGMASLVTTTAEGSSVEIGMVGNEGLVGLPVILWSDTSPYDMMIQFPANALRIRAASLKAEFNRGERLQELLLRYVQVVLIQFAQSASCNRFHTMEARLCRWLLVSRDCTRVDTLPLTQEFLSLMLGTPRTNVTVIAGKLQKLGLITYRRGKIQILDKRGLEEFSCECYKVVKGAMEHFRAA